MVKLFLGAAAIFTLAAAGVFTAVFGPMIAGANRNLGGSPTTPFHSPLPQPIVTLFTNTAAQTTPSILLIGIIAIIALLAVYTIGTFIGHGIRRWKGRRQRWAELRWRGRVSAALRKSTPTAARSKAEFESMWK